MLGALVAMAAPAAAAWPQEADVERLVDEARLARLRLDFPAANAALDAAAAQGLRPLPRVTQERGLLARDRGDLGRAYELLKAAADDDPLLPARLDAAGVLVQLGRSPEAIVVLRQALEARGSSLPVEQITADRRFVSLAALRPYQEVIEAARAEQSGPFGRVLGRLERLQDSTAAVGRSTERLVGWLDAAQRLLGGRAAAVVLVVLVGTQLAQGLAALGLLRPPWPLCLGLAAAALGWMGLVASVSGGAESGAATALCGLLGGGGAVALAHLAAAGWRRLRQARRGAHDPLVAEHLPDTLALVDEVSRLGHRVVSGRKQAQPVLVEALRQAAETLRERLERGA